MVNKSFFFKLLLRISLTLHLDLVLLLLTNIVMKIYTLPSKQNQDKIKNIFLDNKQRNIELQIRFTSDINICNIIIIIIYNNKLHFHHGNSKN